MSLLSEYSHLLTFYQLYMYEYSWTSYNWNSSLHTLVFVFHSALCQWDLLLLSSVTSNSFLVLSTFIFWWMQSKIFVTLSSITWQLEFIQVFSKLFQNFWNSNRQESCKITTAYPSPRLLSCQFHHICIFIFSLSMYIHFYLKHLRVSCKPGILLPLSCYSVLKFIFYIIIVQWSSQETNNDT